MSADHRSASRHRGPQPAADVALCQCPPRLGRLAGIESIHSLRPGEAVHTRLTGQSR
jgi:hypothetical protein